MERQELENRRADNQVWNGAGDYAVRPGFHAFDPEGAAELYFNTMIGLTFREYDFRRFQNLFNVFQTQADGALYCDLFWLGLEGVVYVRALPHRPALATLRRDYAVRAAASPGTDDAFSRLRAAWFRRALGTPGEETVWERDVLDALTFSPTQTEAQIAEQMEALLYRYFHRARRSVTDRQWSAWVGREVLDRRQKQGGLVRADALRRLGRSESDQSAQTGAFFWQRRKVIRLFRGETKERVLREYVEDCFGASMLTPAEQALAERQLCTGAHKNCRLHFTRGELPKRPVSTETDWERREFDRQRAKNRAYYQERLVQNQLIIAQLAQRLQNTLLLQSDVTDSRARAGRLAPGVAWRSAALQDEKIFVQRWQSVPGDLAVDVLLDGSASQNRQQEQLATQAYLIAESLTRCRIPVRVSEFCSVSGCTVLRVFRDYNEFGKNDAVFDYTAAGWNRDGLALRAIGWLMDRSPGDHRLLILLSDASPNDDQRLPREGRRLGTREYTGAAGVRDATAEAAALRRRNMAPVCVFTGSDQELPAARQIYGRDLARIPSVGWFADTVGKLIQGRIAAL